MRALETGRVMLRAANTGVSAIIDYKGGVVTQSRQFTTESITGLIYRRSAVTPFYYFAQIQGFLAVIFLVLATSPVLISRRMFRSKTDHDSSDTR
jgi:apolipoprotein N-acyltransferase